MADIEREMDYDLEDNIQDEDFIHILNSLNIKVPDIIDLEGDS